MAVSRSTARTTPVTRVSLAHNNPRANCHHHVRTQAIAAHVCRTRDAPDNRLHLLELALAPLVEPPGGSRARHPQ